jgi:hypothetical protein
MQKSKSVLSNTQYLPSAAIKRVNTSNQRVRVLLNRALLDSIAWNIESRARRKRLGLE